MSTWLVAAGSVLTVAMVAVDRMWMVEGEPSELQRFVRVEYPTLVAALAVISGSRAVAEDTAQEALARAVLALRRGREIRVLGAWVRAVSVNLLRNRWRTLVRERLAVRRVADQTMAGTRERETYVDLERAVAELPRREREAVALYYLLDLTVSDTAGLMRVSDGTVKTLLSRARHTLAAALTEEEGRHV